MRRNVARTLAISSLLLVLIAVGTAASSVTLLAQQGQQDGLFGRVSGIASPSPGLNVLTLETTTQGEQRVEAAENTVVTIPGMAGATADDISPGDFLAVSGERADDDSLRASIILVKPDRPALHAHVTGAIAGVMGHQVSIIDKNGNVVTADLLQTVDGIFPDQVVTALTRHDPRTGSLSLLGVESADAKITRLHSALKRAIRDGATQNQHNLGERLRGNSTAYLTALAQLLNRVDSGLGPIFDQAVRSLEELLGAYELGKPTVMLAGVIDDIDRAGGVALVSPREGPQVRLRITGSTVIRRFGREDVIENIERGHEVESLYDPQTGEARTIDVLFPTLRADLSGGLLAQAGSGELEGTINVVVPGAVIIRLGTGKFVTLTTTPETRVRIGEQQAELEDLGPLVRVKVGYSPTTMEALVIETFDRVQGQAFISGVVKSFVPKIKPAARIPGSPDEGNILIISIAGETEALNITDSTIIERDGERRNIGILRVGDLVRPTSRYDTSTRELHKLSLRTPVLQGTILARVTTPGGARYLTVSTDGLNMVTVMITDTTEIARDGERVDFLDLEVGEEVASGLYNPLTLQASSLSVQPPETARVTGTILELDRERGVATVAPDAGEPVVLLIPAKPGIIIVNGSPRSIEDLKVGDEVRAAFYNPNSKIVARIFTMPQ